LRQISWRFTYLCWNIPRIFKTEFLLSYLSEPRLRARIRRGLLKVEQLHALARDIYYGRRGRINARELHEQMNSCSCLTLLLACVVYWQAKEISRVLKMGIPEGEDINISLPGACQPHRLGKRHSLRPVCAQPGRHSLKP
jgi:TnpA family transposase